MRKKAPKDKPAKAALWAKTGVSHPLLDVLNSLDEATLERLRAEIGAGDLEDDDPVEMFAELLASLSDEANEAAGDDDFLNDIVLALTQLSIDDNGGDPRARESRSAVYDKLEEELGRHVRQARVHEQLTQADGWVTASDLADQLGVTTRSVRNYVAAAKAAFPAWAAKPAPALDLAVYAGTYVNDYYGDAVIVRQRDGLLLKIGPAQVQYAFTHLDGNVFTFTPHSENASEGSISTATFAADSSGKVTRLTIELLDQNGIGTFKRAGSN